MGIQRLRPHRLQQCLRDLRIAVVVGGQDQCRDTAGGAQIAPLSRDGSPRESARVVSASDAACNAAGSVSRAASGPNTEFGPQALLGRG